MENQIPDEIKHERFNRLKEEVEKLTEINNDKYVGTTQKVLVEGTSKNNDKMLSGRTDSNKVVIFLGEEKLIGKMVNIKIERNALWYLQGKIST
jgi:tRNA-2-methylthio-N6-dimethylallyladenosine synthase